MARLSLTLTTLGYTVEVEKFVQNIRCVGAPVYNAKRRIIAAIGATSGMEDLPVLMVKQLDERVKQTVRKISWQIGLQL